MWPRHIKFKPCFHINTRRLLDGNASPPPFFFFFFCTDKRKVKWKWLAGLLWQWGDMQMGLGNWSMSVKLEKGSSASAGRHVNAVEAHRREDRPTQPFLIKNPISILKGRALALAFFIPTEWFELRLNLLMGSISVISFTFREKRVLFI